MKTGQSFSTRSIAKAPRKIALAQPGHGTLMIHCSALVAAQGRAGLGLCQPSPDDGVLIPCASFGSDRYGRLFCKYVPLICDQSGSQANAFQNGAASVFSAFHPRGNGCTATPPVPKGPAVGASTFRQMKPRGPASL
jgi:hypothetical protein